MGHYCKICSQVRPNEKFSGRGHKNHICKDCARLPKEQRAATELKDEIFGLLRQSHISKKNISRLKKLAFSDNPTIVEFTSIVLEIAEVAPYKKRRLKILAQNKRRDLIRKLEDTGLILAHII